MIKDQFDIAKLISGHLKGELDADQEAELNKWLQNTTENQAYLEKTFYKEDEVRDLLAAYNSIDEAAIWSKTMNRLQNAGSNNKKAILLWPTSIWHKIAAAASIILVVAAGLYFYNIHDQDTSIKANHIVYKNDVKPGGNKAFLTLDNGVRISLTDAKNGELARQSGITITKTATGQLVYTLSNLKKTKAEFNKIETPKGGQYQVHLPDGTWVWLNAASSLKYPTAFNGKERKVELTGEAYFEVAKSFDKSGKIRVPFIVKTAQQEVEVLGTHFNINAYTDETATKTTLLEGSVRIVTLNPQIVMLSLSKHALQQAQHDNTGILKQVQDDVVLKPGQQSSLTNNKIQVEKIDTELAIAWKDGFFNFKNTPLQAVMRQIARWYDVEVIYQRPELKDETLSGSISRYTKVSGILGVLELTGAVKFKVEGKKITVL